MAYEDSFSCCTSPQKDFTIRNNGLPPLANDTPVTVALPEGVISAEGIAAIGNYLFAQARELRTRRQMAAAYDLENLVCGMEALGSEWQTRAGNYPKRLSSYAYKNGTVKLTPAILSQVGVIAREHSKTVAITIDVTRDLNQGPAYFYHGGSCWWGGTYGESRCALKTNGGFGLRSLTPRYAPAVTGRAWVMPLRQAGNRAEQLTPTFATMTADAFVMFNGYGELNSYTPARLMAAMTGWTYRRIDFDCRPMCINNGGYLIGPEEITQAADELYLNVPQHARLFADEQAALAEQAEQAEQAALAALGHWRRAPHGGTFKNGQNRTWVTARAR